MGKSSKKKPQKKSASGASKPMTDTTNPSIVPLECSQEEYQELVSQVAQLTPQEAQEELLDCARYGEVDAVRAILGKFPELVDAVEPGDSGNTALHKASANGHAATTKLLLQNGASLQTNSSGNTPLHWAAASGHAPVIELLLQHFTNEIDVLQKNDFGRSILTEGFSSQCTEVVKLLLEHDSATEEKLLAGGQQVDAKKEDGDEAETNDAPKKKMATITHDFTLYKCESEDDKRHKPLRIRELQIDHADNPFGQEAAEDTTGYGIWCASLVMARWMACKEMQERFDSNTILELGAGCGVPGLAAAHYSNATRVYVTDLNPTTVENLQYNLDLNFDNESDNKNQKVICNTIDWDDEATWPKEKIDYVIGSDLIYQESIVPLLKKVVLGLLKPNTGRFLYVAPDTGRDGLDEFIETMKRDGCTMVNVEEAPKSYHANPLTSGDEEDCFLHFNELASSTYMLYEFAVATKS